MEATDRVDPLFKNEDELNEFRNRHAKAVTPKADIKEAVGPCYLGIDAGSTTLKSCFKLMLTMKLSSHIMVPIMVNH